MSSTERFEARTGKSKQLFERSLKVSPGGVQSNPRFAAPYPLFMREGSGSRIRDVDGNEYVDFCMGLGPLILGHKHPAVMKAVVSQLERGWQLIPANEGEIELAEKIRQHVPSAELVRFCVSGTEGTMQALRLARAYTGRSKVVKFEGAYHGHHDNAYISVAPNLSVAGPRERPNSVPDSAGLLEAIPKNTIILPFNDPEALERCFEQEANAIAGLIVEPFMRTIAPRKGYLELLRKVARGSGSVLIFDEVVTGFRPCLGGAQEHYGVVPDLTVLGKIIGGGFAVGGVAGKKSIMELMDPRNRGPKFVQHAGTFTANPVTTAAGLATINELEKPGCYQRLGKIGDELAGALQDAAEDNNVQAQVVVGCGAILGIYFTDKEVYDYRSSALSDKQKLARFREEIISRGLYPAFGEKFYTSMVHTDQDVEFTSSVFHDSMKAIASD